MDPPSNPVPVPNGTKGSLFSLHFLSINATSSTEVGSNTTLGIIPLEYNLMMNS